MSRALRSAVVALTIAFVVGACSSDDDGASTASTTSTTAGATSTTSAKSTSSTTPTRRTAAWTTYLHDAARSGAAPDGPPEAGSVRRRWTSPSLDGDVYAQPLVVGDRVIVATENDTVYTLRTSNGAVLWQTHLGEPVSGGSLPCGNVDPVGITGTPVVDTKTGHVYAAGMVSPGRHELFALDLDNGKRVASVVVDAPGADPRTHNQRGALSLVNGKVLVPFGGRFGDCGTYHGQVVAVPTTASGLGTPASYTLPTENEGGFWEPAESATITRDGSILITSGNSSSHGHYDYGNSVVRLSPTLRLQDSFAPTDWSELNGGDVDLGTTGPVLLPHGRVFQVGKAGIGYLLDAAHLGGVGGQLHDAKVCDGAAFGAVARRASRVFVPCTNGVVAVDVTANRFTTAWTGSAGTPGPTIVTTDAVWTVATGSGQLLAFDLQSGRQLFSDDIGSVPSRFTSAAAGGGRVIVAADRKVLAYG